MKFGGWLLLVTGLVSSGFYDGAPPDFDPKEVVCFVYHRFGDSRYPSTNIPVASFEAQLQWLNRNDYSILTLSEAIHYLSSNGPTKKVAVLTIDDGFKTFYKNAFPLLKKYHATATVFFNTETVGSPDYMGWDELKELVGFGIEMGNHTHTHAYFLDLPKDRRYQVFKDEIEQSQELIKNHLQVTPEVFAYPYGEFDEQMESIVREEGFVAAAAQNSGVLYGGTDRYRIPRFPMSESFAAINKFIDKAQMHALRINKEEPAGFVATSSRPLLKLSIPTDNLDLAHKQCFVQGGTCTITMGASQDSAATLTLQSYVPISARRRTLYTLTIPDRDGGWHWYSHLWINPDVH